MAVFNVHIYREMKLRFDNVEADSIEAAAEKAREMHFDDAADWSDCEGETLAALVDVQGDEEFEQSQLIDFEPWRMAKASSAMLKALVSAEAFIAGFEGDDMQEGIDDLMAEIRSAIAGVPEAARPATPSDIHAYLAERRQIAHIWGIDDVKQERPDLDDDQCWAVLQDIDRHLDSEHGISWDTIRSTADELYPEPTAKEGDAA